MADNNEQYIIELIDVCKKFPDSDVYAVENFNLKIKKGYEKSSKNFLQKKCLYFY